MYWPKKLFVFSGALEAGPSGNQQIPIYGARKNEIG
jgi:hypothetical protein